MQRTLFIWSLNSLLCLKYMRQMRHLLILAFGCVPNLFTPGCASPKWKFRSRFVKNFSPQDDTWHGQFFESSMCTSCMWASLSCTVLNCCPHWKHSTKLSTSPRWMRRKWLTKLFQTQKIFGQNLHGYFFGSFVEIWVQLFCQWYRRFCMFRNLAPQPSHFSWTSFVCCVMWKLREGRVNGLWQK